MPITTTGQAFRDVAAFLPAHFMTARQIHQAVDCWSPVTVAQALLWLVAGGKAERLVESTVQGGCRYRYRRIESVSHL